MFKKLFIPGGKKKKKSREKEKQKPTQTFHKLAGIRTIGVILAQSLLVFVHNYAVHLIVLHTQS